jgi:hypothetical protein
MTADTAICFMPYEIFNGLRVLYNFYNEDSYSEISWGWFASSPLPTLFRVLCQTPTQTQIIALPLTNGAILFIVGQANLEHIFHGKIDYFALVGK